jgi:type I restriction enzyme S subunit
MSTKAQQVRQKEVTTGDSELPEGWCEARLAEVANARLGKTPGKSDYRDSGDHRIVKFRDLKKGGVDYSSIKAAFVPSNSSVLKTLQPLKLGDVLITASAHSGDQIGKKCSFVDHLPSDNKGTYFVGELLGISADARFMNPKWAFYWFSSEAGLQAIQNAVFGVHLTSGRAQNIPLPVAPRYEQDRITSVLNHLWDRLSVTRNRLSKVRNVLKHFRQAVLTTACLGKLTEEWRERHPDVEHASVLLKKPEVLRKASRKSGRDSEPLDNKDEFPPRPELPQTWEWCTVGQVSTVCLGGTPSRKQPAYWAGEISWVSSGEVANCRIRNTRESISALGLKESNAKIYPKGSVLIAMIGEGKTRGQSAILDIEACTNQNVAGLIFDAGNIDPEYIWLWALGEYERTRAIGRGGNQPALNGEKVRNLNLALPPLEEQGEIVRRAGGLLKLADAIEKRVAAASLRAERLMQAILEKAFRGELLLTEAELARRDGRDYEPASVLLQRIKGATGGNGVAVGRGMHNKGRLERGSTPRKH